MPSRVALLLCWAVLLRLISISLHAGATHQLCTWEDTSFSTSNQWRCLQVRINFIDWESNLTGSWTIPSRYASLLYISLRKIQFNSSLALHCSIYAVAMTFYSDLPRYPLPADHVGKLQELLQIHSWCLEPQDTHKLLEVSIVWFKERIIKKTRNKNVLFFSCI